MKDFPATYVLVLRVPKNLELKTVSKKFKIEKGYYIYVGSALSGAFRRIGRHERSEKRKFWHIDFLLEKSELILSFILHCERRLEDRVAALLRGSPVHGFGASDSDLSSHLFWYPSLTRAVDDAIRSLLQARGRQ